MTEIDTHYSKASRDEIEQLQLERLQATLHRVYKNVKYYRDSFHAFDFFPDSIVGLEGLQKLPTTERKTLVKNHPYGMFAVPLREVIRLQPTSSVSKEAIVVGFTRNDIDHWTDLAARSLISAGVGRDDVVQIYVDYGMFQGALGLHYGAEKIGASVIPSSSISPDTEFEMMRDYHTTVLVTTPHRARRLTNHVKENNIDTKRLTLKTCLLVGQYWSESVRRGFEESMYAPVFDCYGHSEVVSSGIGAECGKRNGLHINEDHFIAEIIDPNSGDALGPGREGELVITTLTKEAFPLIRYRTGDITGLHYEPCGCGSNFVRMERVSRRTDDMVFIGGINLFPSQIERIITDAVETGSPAPAFQLILEGTEASESVELQIEVNEAIFSDELRVMRAIEDKIRGELFDMLGVTARVNLVEPGKLSLEGKGKKRVIDRREAES